MLLNWLRSAVRAAVLSGINDALQEVAPDDQAVTPDVLADLRRRLTPQLPAPDPKAEDADTRPTKRQRAAT